MRRHLVSILAAGAAMAVAAVFGATPASASGTSPWTVSPGGDFMATSTDTALTNNGSTIHCARSLVAGVLKSGSGLDGDHIATLNEIIFDDGNGGSCPGPLGSTFDVTAATPWFLNAVTFESGTGVTSGTITEVNAHLEGSIPIFGTCGFDVIGSVSGTYSNGTWVLSITSSNLTITNVSGSGCGVAQIGEGDTPAFTGNYTVNPHQTITMP